MSTSGTVTRALLACVSTILVTAVAAPVAQAGWVIQTAPSPGSAAGLASISCSGAGACTAVGSQVVGGVRLPLAERWNGATWTVQPSSALPSASQLTGVSCPSLTSCFAVGYTTTTTKFQPFAAQWDGTSWTLAALPFITDSATLTGVSCTNATACTGVGGDLDTGAAVAVRWDGTSWSQQTTPSPSLSTGATFYGVSCPAATYCVAVGQYAEFGIFQSFAEHWNGTAWTVDPSATPVTFPASYLGAVSCLTTHWCEAVGFNVDPFDTFFTMAEHWNGTTWTMESTPTPPLATAYAPFLNGVSCPSEASCTAVGEYVDPTITHVTLALHRQSGTWTLQSTPNPSGSGDSELTGVACPIGGQCLASGFAFGGGQTLIERSF